MSTGAGKDLPTDPLRAGIAAAKAGQRAEARALLQKAVERDDRNVTAWLWLSGVIDELDNRAACLEHVLEIDPQNEAARRGLEQIRRQRVDEMLRSGIEAAKKGQRDHARKQLMEVVELDERNLAAWLWLSGLVASLDDRQLCLENVLALDPQNEAARRGLEQVAEQKAAIAPKPVTVYEPPPVSRLEETSFAVDEPTPRGDLSDEYLCPYCAAETDPEAKKCPRCGGNLVIKQRRRETRSTAWWILFILQVPYALAALAVLIAMAYVISKIGTVTSPENLPPSLAPYATQMTVWLVLAAAAIIVACLLSLVIVAGLIFLWRPVFWLFVAQAAISVIMTAAMALSSAQGIGIICGGIDVLVALAMLRFIFQIEDDFAFDYFRIRFRTDRECKAATDFFAHAGRYSRQGMWALTALHLERAVGMMPDAVDGHLALSSAYMKLERFDRAAEEIEAARKIRPDDPQVAEQAALLEKSRPAGLVLAPETMTGKET